MPTTTVFKNCRLIDGRSNTVQTDAVVVIENERIRSVSTGGEDQPFDEDARVIDLDGKTLMPGLIDAHMHFFGTRTSDPLYWAIEPEPLRAMRATHDAETVLKAGFTSVRDCGGIYAPHLKTVIDEGIVDGPRIVASRLGICRTGGHGDVHAIPSHWMKDVSIMAVIVDGPEECRKAVREQIRQGADFVKTWATGGVLSERDMPDHSHMMPEELDVIVREAHALGRKVAAHCQGIPGTYDAVRAGVDTIEHGFMLDRELCEIMKENGQILVPTLSFIHRMTDPNRGLPEYALRKAPEFRDRAVESCRIAIEVGVKIAMGTDTFAEPSTPPGENAQEIPYLVKSGMTPMQALIATTATAAEALQMEDEVGSVEPGKLADLLVVKGDPSEDVSILSDTGNIDAVVKGGRFVVDHIPEAGETA